MSTVGIWCTLSSDEYSYLPYTLANAVANPAVRRIVIVVTGPSEPIEFGRLSAISGKFHEVFRPFGHGYDRSVDDGGYDQVSARNFALELVESSDVEWLMQYDADDYYHEGIFGILGEIEAPHDYVTCPCYTVTSLEGYWYTEALMRSFDGIMLLNPHTRIWRRDLKLRYQISPRAIATQINHTRHCGVVFPPKSRSLAAILNEPYHFHLHCLLGKRYATIRSEGRKFDFSLPASLIECIEGLRGSRRAERLSDSPLSCNNSLT